MDYFSVIILIIVVFVFMTDRKIKKLDTMLEVDSEILNKVADVKTNLKIIRTNKMDYDSIVQMSKEESQMKEYVLVVSNKINLSKDNIDTLIANYIISSKRTCGFNLTFVYNEKKFSFKKMYVDIINYLNIFNKQELSTYAVIICKSKDLLQNEKEFKQQILSYNSEDFTCVNITKEQLTIDNLKKLYIEKLRKGNITIIIKLLLLIISGSLITSNLIYTVFNIDGDITKVVIPLVIYFCYSYIIRYVYSPIGRRKIIASYIFPIYFLAYIIVTLYTLITKVIKKVQAS